MDRLDEVFSTGSSCFLTRGALFPTAHVFVLVEFVRLTWNDHVTCVLCVTNGGLAVGTYEAEQNLFESKGSTLESNGSSSESSESNRTYCDALNLRICATSIDYGSDVAPHVRFSASNIRIGPTAGEILDIFGALLDHLGKIAQPVGMLLETYF